MSSPKTTETSEDRKQLEVTAFRKPNGRGYLVYHGDLEKPGNEEPDVMSKADLKFIEKRGMVVHWREEWKA